MTDELLTLHTEALIFCAKPAISLEKIREVLEEHFDTSIPEERIDTVVERVRQKYKREDSVFELVEIADGFQLLTKAQYYNTILTYIKSEKPKRLTRSVMETLSIIAYKQPVTKSEIEEVRGVNSDYAVSKLLEKELVEVEGRSDEVGKPLLFVTSQKFMDYFGLRTMDDLPQMEDFVQSENAIGEPFNVEN